MQGWILYYRNKKELDDFDNGVKRLLQAAEQLSIELDVICPESFDLLLSAHEAPRLLVDGKERALPDFIIPRQGSQTTYLGFAVIRYLESLGVYSCNSADTVEIVKDKWRMHQLMRQNNLPMPKTYLVQLPFTKDLSSIPIKAPLVIKSLSGTEGKGIYLIHSESQLIDLLELLEAQGATGPLLLQEFIQSSSGQDLRVFVLGDKVIGCIKRQANSGFKANFCRGGQAMPYVLTPYLEQLALKTARLVNLEIGGIDILLEEDNFKICEANSSPGFKGLESVIGNTVAEQILAYIQKQVEDRNQAKRVASVLRTA